MTNKIIALMASVLLSGACSALTLKSHPNRRYRVVDGKKACFSHCERYKKILFWDRAHTTGNCIKRAEICYDLADSQKIKEMFPRGWVIINESRIQ